MIRPVYLQLCQYLGTDPADRPGRWLDIPRRVRRRPRRGDHAGLPGHLEPRHRPAERTSTSSSAGTSARDLVPAFGAVRRPPGGTRPPRPRWPGSTGTTCPPTGSTWPPWPAGASGSRTCKTRNPTCSSRPGPAAARPPPPRSRPRTPARTAGWSTSSTPSAAPTSTAKPAHDVLTNVPGIRVHTDIESMMWALEEFFLSMLGVNIAVGARTAWPGAFPQRLLVIDEFGTFAGMAARMWRRTGGTGPSPALDQRRQIEWQGRQAGHRLVRRGPPAEPAAVRRLRQPRPVRLPADHRGLHHLAVADDVRVRAPDRMGCPDQGPGRRRHRRSRRPDPPRPARLDAGRRAPPVRADRPAPAGLVHRDAARPRGSTRT